MVDAARGTAPKCRCQHVVPRFIVSNFSEATGGPIVWTKNEADAVVATGPGDSRFYEEHLYSDALDYSWMGYESNAATTIGSLTAGGAALRAVDYWWYLAVTVAGMVARDRMLPRELDSSTWSYQCPNMSNDQKRCLAFDCVLSSLLLADIRIVRSNKPFLNNDRGYSWDLDRRRLFAPVSSWLALVASWDDPEPNGMPARVIDLSMPTRKIGSLSRVDVDSVNFKCAWQAASVIYGCSEELVSGYAVIGDESGFVRWLSSWLPSRACYSWAPVFDEIGRREQAGWDLRSLEGEVDSVTLGYSEAAGGLEGLMRRLMGHHRKVWTPIWLSEPDRSGVLAACASMVNRDMVMVDYGKTDDWGIGSWRWIPREASYARRD